MKKIHFFSLLCKSYCYNRQVRKNFIQVYQGEGLSRSPDPGIPEQ